MLQHSGATLHHSRLIVRILSASRRNSSVIATIVRTYLLRQMISADVEGCGWGGFAFDDEGAAIEGFGEIACSVALLSVWLLLFILAMILILL